MTWSTTWFTIDLLNDGFRKVREDSCCGLTESQYQIVLGLKFKDEAWNRAKWWFISCLYLCFNPNVLSFKPTVCWVFTVPLFFPLCPPQMPSSWLFLRVARKGKSMTGLELFAKNCVSFLLSDPTHNIFHHCGTVIIPSSPLFSSISINDYLNIFNTPSIYSKQRFLIFRWLLA